MQDCEVAIKDKFDAVLDTIGIPETERLGVNVLRRGGHYMTLQVIFIPVTTLCSKVLSSYFIELEVWPSCGVGRGSIFF